MTPSLQLPAFKLHSRFIQGLFKVHSRFHSRLFLPVFKVVQGYSRLKVFPPTLKIPTHSLGFRLAQLKSRVNPGSVQVQSR
jgi:hypothetical protein